MFGFKPINVEFYDHDFRRTNLQIDVTHEGIELSTESAAPIRLSSTQAMNLQRALGSALTYQRTPNIRR